MPQWLLDLILNIFSEIIGIGLTVFFIDKLLKKREEGRWFPSKSFVYMRMARLISELTLMLSRVTTFQNKTYYYDFGKIRVRCFEFKNAVDRNNSEITIKNGIQPKLVEMTLDHKKREANWMYKFADDLDVVLDNTTHLIDPDLLEITYQLRESLANMYSIEAMLEHEKYASLLNASKVFEDGVWKIVSDLERTREILLTKSTARLPLKDGFLDKEIN